jgi:lipopolysaccharide transport system ATP-binding protein
VGSLLEVGTGFHPELTGRENVYMNGTILGMKRREITAKFDEIIAFSGIERFIDTPVKRYSSGMSVRLAFAVAAHLEPDILIIDEVLAVGDSAFQEKCLGKMDDVARQGRTILFVSHQMGSVSRLCTRGIYLSAGRVKVNGTVEEVVETYIRENSSGHAGSYTVSDTGHPPGGARILSATLKDSEDRDSGEVDYHRAHSISVRLETSGVKDLTLTLAVVDSYDRRLFATKIPCPDGPDPITLSLRFPPATILPGGYHLQLALLDHQHHPHDLVPLAFRYTLSDPGGHLELPPHGGYGLVALPVTYSRS